MRRLRGPWVLAVLALAAQGCQSRTADAGAGEVSGTLSHAPDQALSDSAFAALSRRISEPGGYFDTDNLISNERGYLKVVGALERLGIRGGAYVGVGPDQSFSYIAHVRPRIAFIIDIRRDNLLHHLLLKALMEGAPTRAAFLADLHGRPPPADPLTWADSSAASLVTYVAGVPPDPARVQELQADVERAVRSFGIPVSQQDLATVRRFHQAFVDAGPDLRFTTLGRPPRPHYPTYGELILETDLDGRSASYLADADGYRFVRELQRANRIIPVVGDLAGPRALGAMGDVLREMGLAVTALYASNVEFYLWGEGTFDRWVANVRRLPRSEGAVLIRSYFPNFGRIHPSAVPGYFATQSLQPLEALVEGGFSSYWDAVTRGVVPLG